MATRESRHAYFCILQTPHKYSLIDSHNRQAVVFVVNPQKELPLPLVLEVPHHWQALACPCSVVPFFLPPSPNVTNSFSKSDVLPNQTEPKADAVVAMA